MSKKSDVKVATKHNKVMLKMIAEQLVAAGADPGAVDAWEDAQLEAVQKMEAVMSSMGEDARNALVAGKWPLVVEDDKANAKPGRCGGKRCSCK